MTPRILQWAEMGEIAYSIQVSGWDLWREREGERERERYEINAKTDHLG
jgi:hypothetical protein